MGAGLEKADSVLKGIPPPRIILLFTDGMPTEPPDIAEHLTRQVATECRASDIQIVAIAAGDAGTAFLKDITADPSLVISVAKENFEEAFMKAGEIIKSLIEQERSARP